MYYRITVENKKKKEEAKIFIHSLQLPSFNSSLTFQFMLVRIVSPLSMCIAFAFFFVPHFVLTQILCFFYENVVGGMKKKFNDYQTHCYDIVNHNNPHGNSV